MSYSRWSFSCWYAFADADRIDDEPTLNINCEKRHTFTDLSESKSQVLQDYRTTEKYTVQEIIELGEIIDDFLEDYRDEMKLIKKENTKWHTLIQ